MLKTPIRSYRSIMSVLLADLRIAKETDDFPKTVRQRVKEKNVKRKDDKREKKAMREEEMRGTNMKKEE